MYLIICSCFFIWQINENFTWANKYFSILFCFVPYILFYIDGPAILHCFELRGCLEITQIQNGNFKIVRFQKLIRSLKDVMPNVFLKRANEHFLLVAVVINVNDMGIKMSPENSPVVCVGYVKQKLIA